MNYYEGFVDEVEKEAVIETKPSDHFVHTEATLRWALEDWIATRQGQLEYVNAIFKLANEKGLSLNEIEEIYLP